MGMGRTVRPPAASSHPERTTRSGPPARPPAVGPCVLFVRTSGHRRRRRAARTYTPLVLPAPPPPASAEISSAPLGPPPTEPTGPSGPSGPSTGWRRPGRTTWMLAGAAVAGCAYLAVVDPNQSTWYPQCPFKAITGWDCPGCGITRALRAMVTGHPLRAFDHNALVVLAALVGIVWYGTNQVRVRRGRPPLTLRHKGWWTGGARGRRRRLLDHPQHLLGTLRLDGLRGLRHLSRVERLGSIRVSRCDASRPGSGPPSPRSRRRWPG